MVARKQTFSVSLDLPRLLLKYAFGLGLDAQKVYQRIGLPETSLKDPTGRMPFDQFNTLWEEIARQSEDPNFGLHFGENAPNFIGGHILFAIMMNCATLKQALEQFCRYHSLLTDVAAPELRDEEHQIVLSGEYPASLGRHYSEAILAMLNVTLYRLTENRIRAKGTFFVHNQPADITEHQRIFGFSLLFEQPHNSLILDRQDMLSPILLANPALLITLEQFAQHLLAQTALVDSWMYRSSEVINKLLWHGEKPRLTTVAQTLAISPRHLQNKLRDEGFSYQMLLDTTRKQIALSCLKRDEMTVCEIAFLLGFSEQSAFNHAFRRWTGLAPTEYFTRHHA